MQSYDGGMSWNFQISPILAVSKVIVDPKTDDLNPPGSCRVLNNEIPPCYTIFAASQGSGVWRSDNQGDTWKQITAPGLTETNVVSLALSPPKTTATMLYAGTEGGRVFKYVPDPTFPTDPTLGKWTEQTTSPVSTSFTPLLPRNPVSLAVHPGGTTFYAGLGGNKGGGGGGLWRSDDDGRHWDEVASILNVKPDSVYALNIIDLPNTTIYAGFSGLKRCLGSTACLDPAFWSNIAVPSDRGVSALAVDPYTQTLMITGNYIGELFRSADGGLTWTKIDIGN